MLCALRDTSVGQYYSTWNVLELRDVLSVLLKFSVLPELMSSMLGQYEHLEAMTPDFIVPNTLPYSKHQ